MSTDGIAAGLQEALRPLLRGDLPVRLTAWDGSVAGPDDAPEVQLNSPDAVRRLLRHPGELGAAQAYVTGEIDLPPAEGETDCAAIDRALSHTWAVAEQRGLSGLSISPGTAATVLKALRAAMAATGLDLRDLARTPAAPSSQAQLSGRRHSLRRDRSAISFHYDLSNEFYSLILEPQMGYSCGYYPDGAPTGSSEDRAAALERGQRDKLDLVCRKLGLEPGLRMLDVGCGWGSLSLHAAEHFGAQVTGVTISAEQKAFIDARITERGLGDRVQIRLQDYREIPERGFFDAVGSLEMGEHVGEGNYPSYVQVLRDTVRPGGRVVVQQMSRSGKGGGQHPGGGPFIENFIAPDMHMRPVGETIAHLERGGLEVRDVQALREHYAWTVDGWIDNLERNADRLTALVGAEVLRVWRLYLVGGSMAFRDGRMGVDQLVMVRPGAAHTLATGRAW